MTLRHLARGTFCAVLAASVLGCGGDRRSSQPAAPATAGANPFDPPAIAVATSLPIVKMDGQKGSIPLSSAASYAWSALIALNWPASTAASTRGVPDTDKPFGQPGTPVWLTMRSKVEVYPGNGSATIAPHGVVLEGGTPVNGPEFGYGDPPRYVYQAGDLQACPGQPVVASPALVTLDETTQIGNNQTFAGAAPATDPRGFNTKPQLIRYAVKMNGTTFSRTIAGRYWYSSKTSPLTQATANYQKALASGSVGDPETPFVNLAPKPPEGANAAGIEIKSAWRPLSDVEARSGRFLTTTVRYYEQPGGTSCYREAEWGLVGMHVISFSVDAPWVIWSTFEQADNILTADGKPTEDVLGVRLVNVAAPTTPMLSSDPSTPFPRVTAQGDYCVSPGARLYFRESPAFNTLPSGGNICVNARWSEPEPIFVDANREAHETLATYLAAHGKGSSPLMYYKLVGAQGVPVDYDQRDDNFYSTETSYQSANVTIETDYSLGNFTGNLVKGVPSNVELKDGKPVPYINTRLLRFQSNAFDFSKMRMGGCAGCHAFAAQLGQDFSFALGDNVLEPEPTDAFARPNRRRAYFPRQ